MIGQGACRQHGQNGNAEILSAVLALQPGQVGLFWCEAGHYVRIRALTRDEALQLARAVAEPRARLLN